MRLIVLLTLSMVALLMLGLPLQSNLGEDSFELQLHYEVFEQYGLEPNVLVANSLPVSYTHLTLPTILLV